jgi:hypothetical protein
MNNIIFNLLICSMETGCCTPIIIFNTLFQFLVIITTIKYSKDVKSVNLIIQLWKSIDIFARGTSRERSHAAKAEIEYLHISYRQRLQRNPGIQSTLRLRYELGLSLTCSATHPGTRQDYRFPINETRPWQRIEITSTTPESNFRQLLVSFKTIH